MTFEDFQDICKFAKTGYDMRQGGCVTTCRRKDMIPQGRSWGVCDKEHCPYVKKDSELLNITHVQRTVKD